jgi:hypothetical protein
MDKRLAARTRDFFDHQTERRSGSGLAIMYSEQSCFSPAIRATAGAKLEGAPDV